MQNSLNLLRSQFIEEISRIEHDSKKELNLQQWIICFVYIKKINFLKKHNITVIARDNTKVINLVQKELMLLVWRINQEFILYHTKVKNQNVKLHWYDQ